MAETVGHFGMHNMQDLLSRARGDDGQVLDITAGWTPSQLTGGQDAVGVVGGSPGGPVTCCH